MHIITNKVISIGGVEIKVSGKVTSQRARTQIFRAGTIKKSGQPAQEAVDKGVAQCIQKSGVLGIVVKIMYADYKMGDGVKINGEKLDKAQKKKAAKLAKTKAEKLLKEDYEIEEEESPLTEEEEQLIDEVDEEDIREISPEPSSEGKE